MRTHNQQLSVEVGVSSLLQAHALRVPVICMIGASNSLVDLPIEEWREIRPIDNARPFDMFCGAKVCGDSLKEDHIVDGDYAIVRVTFERYEITPGRLVAALTPFGLLIKHVYPTLNGKVRLVSANRLYSDLLFDAEDVTIQGVVVRTERDW